MAEWKLFTDKIPEPPEYIASRGWMDLEHQPGFALRAKMVTDLAYLLFYFAGVETVSELGCGDGSLLALMPEQLKTWGYELGRGDIAVARHRALDVRQADIMTDELEYGDLVVCCEVLEHLADPEALLRRIPDNRVLLCSSPSRETGDWHNSIHAWAWDLDGYRDLMARSGWEVLYQTEVDGGFNTFRGVIGQQKFQAVVASR